MSEAEIDRVMREFQVPSRKQLEALVERLVARLRKGYEFRVAMTDALSDVFSDSDATPSKYRPYKQALGSIFGKHGARRKAARLRSRVPKQAHPCDEEGQYFFTL